MIKKNLNFFFLHKSTNNYFYKLYYQFFFFKKQSIKKNYDVWISLQDVIPNIDCNKSFTYFHTPIIFHEMTLKEIYFEPTSFLRSIFFRIYLRIKKLKNMTIITQQSWIKSTLKQEYGFEDIIVAKPQIYLPTKKRKEKEKNIFLYPSLPRFQKNFEVICKASEFLKKKKLQYEIQFTFSKDECRYSKYIYNISKNDPNIKFLGRQKYNQMKDLYQNANFLIFSSKLETWGLPLSEAVSFNLPILVSNLAYAKETLANYDKVYYFDPNNPKKLSEILCNIITKKIKFKDSNLKVKYKKNCLNFPWKKIT